MSKKTQFQLFKTSLANHPGVRPSIIWSAILALSLVVGPAGIEVSIGKVIVWAVVSGLPWIPVLITAWARRNQNFDYEEVY